MLMRQSDKERIQQAVEVSLLNKYRMDDLDIMDKNFQAAVEQQVRIIMSSVLGIIESMQGC